MALFRLAEVLAVADPDKIEAKLPKELIVRWTRYFGQKEESYDKIEFYLVQICRFLSGVVGGEVKLFPRGSDADGEAGEAQTTHISGEDAAGLFRAAFGV